MLSVSFNAMQPCFHTGLIGRVQRPSSQSSETWGNMIDLK